MRGMKITGLFGPTAEYRRRVEGSRRALYRVAFSWCHDPSLADDLVQDTLVKALARAGQLRDPERLRSWLFSILANCLRDHYRGRRESAGIEDLDEQVLATGESPEELHASLQTVARVRAAIARLPLGQRQVVTLVDLEGCSYAEVGEALAVPIGTVMSRLFRARAALRELLLEPGAPRDRMRVVK